MNNQDKQTEQRIALAYIRLLIAILAKTALLVLLAVPAFAGDNTRQRNRNYIIRRQQAYSVQGVPTKRIYTGGRKIDIYPNGLMFERDHVVGVRPR